MTNGARTNVALVIATSLCIWCLPAPAQTQGQTQAQTRRQLLQDIESGQFREAVLLGQQAVSRWPRDAQLRHYLGLAYFESDDLKQAQEQLTRARELNPEDSATHYDLALVLLSGRIIVRVPRTNSKPQSSSIPRMRLRMCCWGERI